MSVLEDLEDMFRQAKQTPYNLNTSDSKQVRKQLSDYCWRFLAPYNGGKPPWFEETDYSVYFDIKEHQYAARIYELMWFANLAFIAEGEPELMDHAARRLETEARSGLVPTRSNLILRGCLEYKRKNYQLAKHYISRAHSELIPDSVVSPFFAYSRSTCLFEEPYDGGRTLETEHPHDQAWVLVAGDASYVIKYLPNYLNSIHQTNSLEDGFSGIHVRVMRTGEADEGLNEVEAIIDDWRRKLGARFEASYMTIPNVRDKRSWFAAERFLHAKSLLNEKRRLVITDLDYALRKHPREFLDWADQFSVCGLLARENEFKSFFPWLKIQAGTVVVSNSPVGRSFLDDYENYFHTAFVGAGWNWGIDQNALANALDNLNGRSEVGNINEVRNIQPFTIPRALKKS